MKLTRLYTGADGHTHIEWQTLENHPELGQMQKAVGVQFREQAPDYFYDFHCAPRRQLVITLEGEFEIGLGDGTVHRFGPGHVTLAEDLTGKGHTTRVVSDVPRVSVTIPLGD